MSSLWDNLTAATKNLASAAQDVLTEDAPPDEGLADAEMVARQPANGLLDA